MLWLARDVKRLGRLRGTGVLRKVDGAEILRLRDERVKLLGFANYAEWQLQDRMAKTPARVLDPPARAARSTRRVRSGTPSGR